MRKDLEVELLKQSASSLNDLEPSRNSHVALKIKLSDPNTKPLKFKTAIKMYIN